MLSILLTSDICWASLVVKNLLAIQETQFQFLYPEDPLKKGMTTGPGKVERPIFS